MAGYRITFDGSLNERKDVPQASTLSSLTSSLPSNASPLTWGYGFSFSTKITILSVDQHSILNGTVMPNSYYFASDLAPFIGTVTLSDGGNPLNIATVGLDGGKSIYFFTPTFTGTYNWSVAWGSGASDQYLEVWKSPVSATRNLTSAYAGTKLYDSFPNFPPPANFVGITPPITGSTVCNNQFLVIRIRVNSGGFPLVMQSQVTGIGGTSPVSIAPSTLTQGISPTGGLAILATPVTITNGQSGLSSPAKLFGAKVVHDLSDIVEAKYLPSADATQDAEASMSESEFFTATDTSVSVEAEGLGSAERLRGGKTTVIIENVGNTVEN